MNTSIKHKYSYAVHLKKLLLGQFGAAMLGIMTSMPTLSLGENKYGSLLGLATTFLAIFFFLYIEYTAIWDIAAKDKIAIDGERMKKDLFVGAKAAILASIPTYTLAILSMIFKSLYLLTEANWVGTIANITYAIELIWNYMYHGILVLLVPESAYSWSSVLYLAVFILLTIPSIITCLFAYRIGLKGKRIIPEKKKN